MYLPIIVRSERGEHADVIKSYGRTESLKVILSMHLTVPSGYESRAIFVEGSVRVHFLEKNPFMFYFPPSEGKMSGGPNH